VVQKLADPAIGSDEILTELSVAACVEARERAAESQTPRAARARPKKLARFYEGE
jgi:hypothetical protein